MPQKHDQDDIKQQERYPKREFLYERVIEIKYL